MSLNKYISDTGICSRREADKWIEAGRVKINNKIAKKGNRVFQGDQVTVDGKPLKAKPKLVYIALHKPVGITCTTDRTDKDNIIDFVNYPLRIFPIGRLDKDSSGLILLTNDGDIVNLILREENEHEKEYIVKIDRPVTQEFVEGMRNGVRLVGLNVVTKKCYVAKLTKYKFKIVLTQGLNRQIRRMSRQLFRRVVRLKRVRIMNIRLGNLREGEWRELTDRELRDLKRSLNYFK
ncbi:MAG TPA: pseudouridine synthase [Oceanospirillales bacterium]|nr:pseudouridine synthase [Oceanospirillales bacterium]